MQQPSWQLGTVLSTLAHLTRAADLLATGPHLGPPHTCSQQPKHLAGTKVGTQLTAMSLVQQQLAAALWYHQSSSFTLAPKDKFKPMPCPHVEHCMCATCPTCKLPHFCVRRLPRGFMDTCQEGWFNLQGQYMPLLRAVCGLTHPFKALAWRCVHHRRLTWFTGSYPAATLTMCSCPTTIHV